MACLSVTREPLFGGILCGGLFSGDRAAAAARKSQRPTAGLEVSIVVYEAARFQGIFASSMPIPQVSVIPAKTRPAPTNADSPRKLG